MRREIRGEIFFKNPSRLRKHTRETGEEWAVEGWLRSRHFRLPRSVSFHRTVSRPSSPERCANLSDKTADGPLANPLGGRQRREGGRMKEGAGEGRKGERERDFRAGD